MMQKIVRNLSVVNGGSSILLSIIAHSNCGMSSTYYHHLHEIRCFLLLYSESNFPFSILIRTYSI